MPWASPGTAWSDPEGVSGWVRLWGTTRVVRDSTSPLSPPFALEIAHLTGLAGGAPPGLRQVYVGAWWQGSAGWQGHGSNVNKIQFLFAGAAGDIVMVMYGPPGGPYELGVIPQFVGLPSEWLRPNVAARPVVPGTWHRIEWLLAYNTTTALANGIVRWWLDGELIGDHTDVPFPESRLGEYKLSPTRISCA